MIDLLTGILIGAVLGGCIVYMADRTLVRHTYQKWEEQEDGSYKLVQSKTWFGTDPDKEVKP